jgi:hypothetical protein
MDQQKKQARRIGILAAQVDPGHRGLGGIGPRHRQGRFTLGCWTQDQDDLQDDLLILVFL